MTVLILGEVKAARCSILLSLDLVDAALNAEDLRESVVRDSTAHYMRAHLHPKDAPLLSEFSFIPEADTGF